MISIEKNHILTRLIVRQQHSGGYTTKVNFLLLFFFFKSIAPALN